MDVHTDITSNIANHAIVGLCLADGMAIFMGRSIRNGQQPLKHVQPGLRILHKHLLGPQQPLPDVTETELGTDGLLVPLYPRTNPQLHLQLHHLLQNMYFVRYAVVGFIVMI